MTGVLGKGKNKMGVLGMDMDRNWDTGIGCKGFLGTGNGF